MSIKIILNNSGPIYPGTLLQGTVQCHFQSRTDVRSIKIRCYGKEHTQWTTGGKHKHHYSGTHYFYQMETKLFEPETSYMEVGSYSYPFTFLLPMNIASVLEFPYGYIRHSLKGIIDIPLAIDPRERLDLNVISVIDINTLPSNLRQPFQAVDQALTGCCFCFDFDPVRMNAQINKRVFIPGETIKINMEIQNMSGDSVTEFIVKLVRCFVAHSETPRHDTRTVNEDLLVQKLGGVGGHGKRVSFQKIHEFILI
ncbi:hypothetical protein HHI36_015856 [Cryptolaemus montrouzieri]|uniref:Arrestin domain-containing protein 3 n=1 Tax=Cryptolaemus montrouzieri TaxID=559131 RepID=A0ABD2N6U8_9CUCU